MYRTLEPGDRIRLKNTVSFGTVVEVVAPSFEGAPARVMVAWDGREDAPRTVPVDDLLYVRPPPDAWPSYEGPVPSPNR